MGGVSLTDGSPSYPLLCRPILPLTPEALLRHLILQHPIVFGVILQRAGDWGLGDSGWRHEKERRPRLTLQSTPSTITQQPSPRILPTFQVYFFNFSSVFHWPFQVVLFYILHHTFNLALNKFKHLTTIQDNYVVVLCRYSDMIILEIFHIMTYTYHLFIDLLQLKFNYDKDYQNVIKLTSLFFLLDDL